MGNWWDDAACKDMPIKTFADDDGWKRIRSAKSVCNGCPVRQQCLDEALTSIERTTWGVWGGFTTGERVRLLQRDHTGRAMYRVRTCPNCGLDFVYQRCYSCSADRTGTQEMLDKWLSTVRVLNDTNHSDSQIAAQLTERTGHTITRKDVTQFRWRNNIPSIPGSDHRNGRRSVDTYEPANVERVALTSKGFTELTNRERVALLRRWLQRLGTVTSFCREYNVNTSTARNLSRKAKELTWMEAE